MSTAVVKPDTALDAALRLVTCGSVDDGKSTLIGRLLLDSRAVLQDQLASVQRSGQTDLALLTDGLQAEREQGITIDVAYRYFNTTRRKFILGDAPGHEQYTRNMVTAASSADVALVLIDASKLDWRSECPELLPQTRRHSLLVKLLRVPFIVFVVNKLDAVADPQVAFGHIRAALSAFASEAGIQVEAVVPISALLGHNVVDARPDWCGYPGPSLLALLERLSLKPAALESPFAFPVQWVEKFHSSQDTTQSRRLLWGRVASGRLTAGQTVCVHPSGQTAKVVQVLDHARRARPVAAGLTAGLTLDRELDVSRGDMVLTADDPLTTARRQAQATVAWMDEEPLEVGRSYWALHGHRWTKAKVTRIIEQLEIHSLQAQPAERLAANAIGKIELSFQEPLALRPYAQCRALGALILVDSASHRTAGAVLIETP
jgi:sulfate adenylyltransferase subunit 1